MTDKDYKATLNLPKTSFPMKANLAQREPNFLKAWGELNLYQKIREQQKGKPKYILPDGPPYANGNIHIGHAMNKVLKDMVLRSKTLSGYDAPFVPFWDCHGLPVELNVEKKKGRAGDKLSHKEFRAACRVYADQQLDKQRTGFIRLGVLADWENPRKTMDYQYEADIVRALGKIIENGHLRQGAKPVHWCVDCRSALAEAEVEYAQKTSPSIDVRFNVIDAAACLNAFGGGVTTDLPIAFVIWTTTPWTLPANQGVALHAELDYVLVKVTCPKGESCMVVAQALLESVLARMEATSHEVLATQQGQAFDRLALQHPFYDRQVPVVMGEHVTIEAGTGCVHTAPAHGQDDYVVGQHYDLPMDNPVGGNGCYLNKTELFSGQSIFKVNDTITALLDEHQALVSHEKIEHSYPHCWRHKTPLIFLATPQWFVSMEQNQLRAKAADEIKKVNWVPDWGQSRIEGMMREGRPDWCVSRQRTWNTPMPLFVHKETSELHPDTLAIIEKVAVMIEREGIEAWFEATPESLIGDDAPQYIKLNDTLDVWFDSGVAHAGLLDAHEALQSPADLFLEGSDQHRGWFQTSLLTSVAMKETAPFKTVLTHGFVMDANGRKMSKSIGNVVEPDKVTKTLGADILRLWVAATDYRNDVAVSDEILKRMSDAYRRIRNTTRYWLSNLSDFEPTQHLVPSEQLLALDLWAVNRARQLQERIIAHYDAFNFHLIYQEIHNFCVVDMGGFYLDIIKDRQYTAHAESLPRRSGQTAMYHIAQAFVRWIAPILSFTAEEIWQCIPDNEAPSVMLSTWYEQLPELADSATHNNAFWAEVIAVRDVVNKALEAKRAAEVIGAPLEAEVTLYCDEHTSNLLQTLEDELRFVLITSQAQVKPFSDKPETAEATEREGLFLEITASSHQKCERCWHRREDVGTHAAHPTLCQRCVENIEGDGETRQYA